MLHLQGLRRVVVVDDAVVEKEAKRCDRDAEVLAIRLFQLAQF